jgi:hypothetical protein
MCRNTSRGDEPFQFVFTGFDDSCQDTIVIQDATFSGLRRTDGHGRHVGHDSGDWFSEIGEHNLLTTMDDWTNDATSLAVQLGKGGLHKFKIHKVCKVSIFTIECDWVKVQMEKSKMAAVVI